MTGLTARQQQCLAIIAESIERRGFPPSHREISALMGMTTGQGSQDHLRALERKGFIRRHSAKSRGLALVPNLAELAAARGVPPGATGTVDGGHQCSELGCPTWLFGDVSICSSCRRAA